MAKAAGAAGNRDGDPTMGRAGGCRQRARARARHRRGVRDARLGAVRGAAERARRRDDRSRARGPAGAGAPRSHRQRADRPRDPRPDPRGRRARRDERRPRRVEATLEASTWAAESVSALLPRTSDLDAVAALRAHSTSSTLAATTRGTPSLSGGDRVIAPITFYYCDRATPDSPIGDGGTFCGHMRDGDIVYSGAAACDYAYLGQRFRIVGDPTGRSYSCADTGSAVHGLHRDIWFQTSDEGVVWQLFIGRRAGIEILPDTASR
jgi:hypothetical protein